MSSDKGINRAKTTKKEEVVVIQLFWAGRAQQDERTNAGKKGNWMCLEKQTMWLHHYTSRAYYKTGDQTEGKKLEEEEDKNKVVGNVQIYKLDWPSVNERLELRRLTKSLEKFIKQWKFLTCWSVCVSSIVSRESFGETIKGFGKRTHKKWPSQQSERMLLTCLLKEMLNEDDAWWLSLGYLLLQILTAAICSCVRITHCFFLFFWLFFLEWMYFWKRIRSRRLLLVASNYKRN